MNIKTTMKSNILNPQSYQALYDQLFMIQFDGRHQVKSTEFEVGKEYTFEGKSGTVTVTFEQSDMV